MVQTTLGRFYWSLKGWKPELKKEKEMERMVRDFET